MKNRFPGPPGVEQRELLIELSHSPEILTLSRKELKALLRLLKANYPHEAKSTDHIIQAWKEAYLRPKDVLEERSSGFHVTASNVLQGLMLLVLVLTLAFQVYSAGKPNSQSQEHKTQEQTKPSIHRDSHAPPVK
ncbi:hypothetical protein [Porticoccus sp.]